MRLLVSAVVAIVVCGLSNSANAQTKLRSELDKVRVDYRDGRPFQYQPSDPFVRSKLFKTQIGHGGWFYNCDNQEAKRNSPYICWKVHHENDLPPKMRCIDRVNCELAEIKQRIYDGAGACCKSSCDDCTCTECQGNVLMASAGKKASSSRTPMRVASLHRREMERSVAVKPNQVVQQRVKQPRPVAKRIVTDRSVSEQGFGLVKGKIIPETSVPTAQVAMTRVPTQQVALQRGSSQRVSTQTSEAKPASKNLMQHLAKVRREGNMPSVEVAVPQKIRTAKATIINAFRPSKK